MNQLNFVCHRFQKKIAARLENDESEKDVGTGNGTEPEALDESDQRFALARKKARGVHLTKLTIGP